MSPQHEYRAVSRTNEEEPVVSLHVNSPHSDSYDVAEEELEEGEDDEESPSAVGRSWRPAAVLVLTLLVVVLLVVSIAPAGVSSHLTLQLFGLRSAFSLLSVNLPALSSSTSNPASTSASLLSTTANSYDPFYRISPATSTYTSHVCLIGFAGRWGNHGYMLNNALYIALQHNLTLHLPRSDNQAILPHIQRFNTPCPPDLPEIHRNDLWWQRERDAYWQTDPRTFHDNHNYTAFKYTLGGYMQYPTSAHVSRRAELRAFYSPPADLQQLTDSIRSAILSHYCSDSVVVAIHIRAGDFPKAENWNYSSGVEGPLQIPVTWYINWLQQLKADGPAMQQLKQWQDSECTQPIAPLSTVSPLSVFLATEDMSNAAVLRAAGYRTINLQEAIALTPGLGSWTGLTGVVGSFWAEWWLLSQFRVLMTSHSSFSLTAALQSPYYESREAVYATPDPDTLSIQRFDPWNVTYDHAAFTRKGRQIVFG